MKSLSPDHHQMSFMSAGLMDQLNPNIPCYVSHDQHPETFLNQNLTPGFLPRQHGILKSLSLSWSLITTNSMIIKGFEGEQINVLMVAAAFNFRKWMRLGTTFSGQSALITDSSCLAPMKIPNNP